MINTCLSPMEKQKQHIQSFQSPEELAEKLAKEISNILQRAIEEKNHAVLVVSGGRSPKPLFIQLAQQVIAWDKVTITLADERWVEPTDPASNEQMVRTYLLQNKAKHTRFIGLKNQSATAKDGEKKCNQILSNLPRPFDVVILGMGTDGHTASLFPYAPTLKEAINCRAGTYCLAIQPEPGALERMTMTAPSLLDTEQIFLHITGQDKKDVLKKALQQGSVLEMPIRAFLNQDKTPVQIYWAP